MSAPWNQECFSEYIRLRDALRSAKRDKNYQNVLSLGQRIIELDKTAGFLQIATYIFLKDMSSASLQLDDTNAAVNYLLAAKQKLLEQKERTEDWQKVIDVVERKLKKLQANA